MLVLYHVPNRDCAGQDAGGAAGAEANSRFVERTVAVLGDSRAAVVLEPGRSDKEPCSDPHP